MIENQKTQYLVQLEEERVARKEEEIAQMRSSLSPPLISLPFITSSRSTLSVRSLRLALPVSSAVSFGRPYVIVSVRVQRQASPS